VIIVYTPEGGEEERYDTRKLLTSEASIAGKAAGMTWPGLREALGEDDPEAMRAVVWVMRKRENLQLRIGDFDPAVDELTVKWDHREIADRLGQAAKMQGASDEERELFHRILVRNAADPQAAEALIKEYADGGPKEPAEASPTSMTSETSTSGFSPSTSDGPQLSSTL
jgi:hypothetical protein